MSQLELGAPVVIDVNRILVEIINRSTGERKSVEWMVSGPGFILTAWGLGGAVKFRSRSGAGTGHARGWVITKGELARLDRKVNGDGR